MHELATALAADLRLTWRRFQKAPLSILCCIAVLALGLGGTTAVFSALYTVTLRPLPYPQPQQLVVVHSQFPRLHMDRLGVSPLDYLDLKKQKQLLSDAGAFFYLDLSRTGGEHAEKVNAIAATASLFETLRVRPALGRLFSPSEERTNGPHAVILSDGYWRAAFGGDRHVLGKMLRLNGELYPVVGVMPRSFAFPNNVTQMWVPAVFKPAWLGHLGHQNVFLRMYGRLADGLTFDQASQILGRISREAVVRNRADYTVDLSGWKYFFTPLAKEENGAVQPWTWVLFWSVCGLLLIICVNVGGLLVLRSTQSAFEVAVRLALGANVWRVARQVTVETGAISAAGGLAGIVVAVAGVRLLNWSAQFGHLELSIPVLAFGVAIAVGAALLCSAYPFWQATRASAVDAMRTGGHQRTTGPRKQYVRRGVVILQLAVSAALLVVGGLLLHTYVRLLDTPLGFAPDGVVTVQISLPPLRYATEASRRSFYETVVARVRHLPGIRQASACTVVPFGNGENIEPFSVPGQSSAAQELASVNNVLPGLLEALRIPLLAGRYFNGNDTVEREGAVIVDRSLAERYFPHQNAVGQMLQMGDKRFRIVGIAGNIKVSGLDVSEVPMLYLNAMQAPVTDMAIVVKTSRPVESVAAMVQAVVTQVDRDQPVYDFAALQHRIDGSLAVRRFVAFLLLGFSVIAIVVTGIGLYGVLSYSVLLREHEFGIRSAVGANAWNLGTLVLQHGMGLVAAGGFSGAAIAVAASRYLAGQLYGVHAGDPVTWISVAAVMAGIGILACIVPCWRAARANALSMLKQE
jgi:predicted permease